MHQRAVRDSVHVIKPGCKGCEPFRLAQSALRQGNHPRESLCLAGCSPVAELTEPRPDSIKRVPCSSSSVVTATPTPSVANFGRCGRARGRGFVSNSDSLGVVTRFAHRHLKIISPPFHEARGLFPFLRSRGSSAPEGLLTTLGFRDVADDGRARA